MPCPPHTPQYDESTDETYCEECLERLPNEHLGRPLKEDYEALRRPTELNIPSLNAQRVAIARWKAESLVERLLEFLAPVGCIFRGHDWGMFWNGKDGYDDICVRCRRKK